MNIIINLRIYVHTDLENVPIGRWSCSEITCKGGGRVRGSKVPNMRSGILAQTFCQNILFLKMWGVSGNHSNQSSSISSIMSMIFSVFTLPTQNNTAVIYKYCNQLISNSPTRDCRRKFHNFSLKNLCAFVLEFVTGK